MSCKQNDCFALGGKYSFKKRRANSLFHSYSTVKTLPTLPSDTSSSCPFFFTLCLPFAVTVIFLSTLLSFPLQSSESPLLNSSLNLNFSHFSKRPSGYSKPIRSILVSVSNRIAYSLFQRLYKLASTCLHKPQILI